MADEVVTTPKHIIVNGHKFERRWAKSEGYLRTILAIYQSDSIRLIEAATMLNVSVFSMCNVARAFGVPTRRKTHKWDYHVRALNHDEIAAEYQNHRIPVTSILARNQISTTTLRKILRSKGVPFRPHGGYGFRRFRRQVQP